MWNDSPHIIDEIDIHGESRSKNIDESVRDAQGVTSTPTKSNKDLVSTLHENEQLGCGHRECCPSSKYKDFICHTVSCAKDPTSKSHQPSYPSNMLYPITHYMTCTNFSMRHREFLAIVTIGPQFNEAVRDPLWRNAMRQEIDALEKNETWTLTTLPPRKKAIGCKWMYKIKYKSNGSVEHHKARLVFQGDNQKEGLDCDETFALIAKMVTIRTLLKMVTIRTLLKMVTIRTLLAVAATRSWILHQIDVHNVFLHGDLDEEVYMQTGFSYGDYKKVCKLQKSLYRLRHAPRNWFAKLATALKKYGFK